MIAVLQVIVAVALIVLILLQERSAGLSGIFGGEGFGQFYQTRRGLEKAVFIATIILALVFAGLAVLQLIV